MKSSPDNHRQFRQSLGAQVNNVEQEARMVLPGIQTIFGFQLMVIFQPSFKGYLSSTEQFLHLGALLLVALSAILVTAPAAYHRQANHQVSQHFIDVSSRFLSWALVPLAIGTSMDIYIVSRMIGESRTLGVLIAVIILFLFTLIWFVYPQYTAGKIRKLPIHKLPPEKTN